MEWEWTMVEQQSYPSLNNVYDWPEISEILKTHEWLQLTSNGDLAASVYVCNGLVKKWSIFLQENEAMLDELIASNKSANIENEFRELNSQSKKTADVEKPANVEKSANVEKRATVEKSANVEKRANVEKPKAVEKCTSDPIHVCCGDDNDSPTITDTVTKDCRSTPVQETNRVNSLLEKFINPLDNSKLIAIPSANGDTTNSARVSIIYSTDLNSLVSKPNCQSNTNILLKRKFHSLTPSGEHDYKPAAKQRQVAKKSFSRKEKSVVLLPNLNNPNLIPQNFSSDKSEPKEVSLNKDSNSDSNGTNNYSVPYSLPCLLDDVSFFAFGNEKTTDFECKKIENTVKDLVVHSEFKLNDKIENVSNILVNETGKKITDSKHEIRAEKRAKKKSIRYYNRKFRLKKCYVALERLEFVEEHIKSSNDSGSFQVKMNSSNRFVFTLSSQCNDIDIRSVNKKDNPDGNYSSVMYTYNRLVERRVNVNTHFTHLRMDDCLSQQIKKIDGSSRSIFNQECSLLEGMRTYDTFKKQCMKKYHGSSSTSDSRLKYSTTTNRVEDKNVKSKGSVKTPCPFTERVPKQFPPPCHYSNAKRESLSGSVRKSEGQTWKTTKCRSVPFSRREFKSSLKNVNYRISHTPKSKVFHSSLSANSTELSSAKKIGPSSAKLNELHRGGSKREVKTKDQIKCGYFSFSLLKDLKNCDVSTEYSSMFSNTFKYTDRLVNRSDTLVKPQGGGENNGAITNANLFGSNQMREEIQDTSRKKITAGAVSPLMPENGNVPTPTKIVFYGKTDTPKLNSVDGILKISQTQCDQTVTKSVQKLEVSKIPESSENDPSKDPRFKNKLHKKRNSFSANSNFEPTSKRLCVRPDLFAVGPDLKLANFTNFTCSSCLRNFDKVRDWILHVEKDTCASLCSKKIN